MATTSDLAGMMAAALLRVRVPTFSGNGAEGAGSAGTRAASPAMQDPSKIVTLKDEGFIDEKLAVSLTGHSERGTLQSLLAGLGVPKEERQYLGRWSASGSDEYVRTYRLMVKRMLGKLGEVLDDKNIFEVVDEAEALETLKEKSEKKLGGTKELESALARSLVVSKEMLLSICGNLGTTLPRHLLEATREDDHGATSVTSLQSKALVAEVKTSGRRQCRHLRGRG